NFGFVFAKANSGKEQLNRTIAHELAHGAFCLWHTFSSENIYVAQRGSTQNLMDYNGTNAELYKYQWDYIHNPQEGIVRWMVEDEEGEAWKQPGTKILCIKDDNVINKIREYRYFYLPTGDIADFEKYVVSGFYAEDDVTPEARGALATVRINGYDHSILYQTEENTNTHTILGWGYKKNNGKYARVLDINNVPVNPKDVDPVRVYIRNNAIVIVNNKGVEVENIQYSGDNSCNCKSDELTNKTYFANDSNVDQCYIEYAKSTIKNHVEHLNDNEDLVGRLVQQIDGEEQVDYTGYFGEIFIDKIKAYEKANDGRRFIVAVCESKCFSENQKQWDELAKTVFIKANLTSKDVLITLPYVDCNGIGRDLGRYYFMPGIAAGDDVKIQYSALKTDYNNILEAFSVKANSGLGELNQFVRDVFIQTQKVYVQRYYYLTWKGDLICGEDKVDYNHTGFYGSYDFRLSYDKRLKNYINLRNYERSLHPQGQQNWTDYQAQELIKAQQKLSDFCDNSQFNGDDIVNHGLNEYLGCSDKDVCLQYAEWYARYLWGSTNDSPKDECFYGGRNQIVYEDNLAAIDVIGLMLSPIGLDFIADAVGAVYALSNEDYLNGSIYAASVLCVGTFGELSIKGLKLGTHAIVEDGGKFIIKEKKIGNIAGGVVETTAKYADNLTGELRKTYDELSTIFDELKTQGINVKYTDDGRFFNSSGDVILEIANGKFTVKKWGAHYEGEVVKKLDNGYWLVENDGTYSIDLGFKEGRTLDAKEVNEYLINTQYKDPSKAPSYGPFSEYKPDSEVKEMVLHKGDKIYIVEDNEGRPGGYASKDKVTTLAEFRDKLAVKEEWKPTSKIPTLREYEVQQDIRVRSGVVGPQNDNGTILFGGGHQYEIIITEDLGWWDAKIPSCLRRIEESTIILK
ncbi:MAG: hypothetical protein J6W13_07180, partial [Salinivirgaceae bacterium]|nr:hypothetical protein [Salinivirgaceae bacterium]